MAPDTFRLMDPVSGRMIGLRADMTPQVARIAATRLKKSARPLRLCYAGQVLRVRGSQLRPERQVGQVGAELIGSDSVSADVEAIAVAVEALASLGIIGLTVDLTLPTLVPAVCNAFKLASESALAVRRALDHKDAAALKAAAGKAGSLLGDLLKAAGEGAKAQKALAALDLPKDAAAERARLGEMVARLKSAVPGLEFTIDPVENRGFEYHTGISFSFFAQNVRGELGRGGRYRTDSGGDKTGPRTPPASRFTPTPCSRPCPATCRRSASMCRRAPIPPLRAACASKAGSPWPRSGPPGIRAKRPSGSVAAICSKAASP